MLSAPVLSEAFFQVDLVDGHGFLDARGALVRRFLEEFQRWGEWGGQGEIASLQFDNPTDPEHPILMLRVGVGSIWVHIRAGTTGVAIRQECSRIVDSTCAVIGVTQFSRQGLRMYHIFGASTAQEAVEAVRRVAVPSKETWTDMGTINSATFGVQFVADRITATLRLTPAQTVKTRLVTEGVSPSLQSPASAQDDTPRLGVLLDADVFDATPSDTRDPKPHLNRALRYVDERALPLVTALLEHGG